MGGLLHATRRGAAPGVVALDGRQRRSRRASGSTWSGCTGSACEACRCSTAGWARPWSCPSGSGTARRSGSDAVATRRAVAEQLGLEFAVATSAGWSAAGAPWVEPADAMKKVVWSETVLEGGRAGRAAARAAARRGGPVPGLPALGRGRARTSVRAGLGRDRRAGRRRADPPGPVIGDGVGRGRGLDALVDGSFAQPVSLPRDPDGRLECLDRARLRRTRRPSRPSPSGSPDRAASAPRPRPRAVLEAQRRRRRLPRRRRSRAARRAGSRGRAGAHRGLPAGDRAAVPARAHRRQRRSRTAPAGRGRARAADPATRLGVPRLGVRAVRRRTGARTQSSRRGSPRLPDYYALDADPASATSAIDPAQVIDVTAHVDARRRAALDSARRGLAGPAVRRVPDRPDERPRSGRGDRTGGRQARRDEGAALPRHLPGAVRRRVTRRPAQRQHRIRTAERDRPAPGAIHRAARLRPDAVAARARRLRRGRRGPH